VSAPPPPRRVGPSAVPPPTPFLALPLESRLEIYRHLLLAHEPISSFARRLNLWPQILATCRQVCEEGKAVLYGENEWGIDIGVLGGDLEEYNRQASIIRPTFVNVLPVFNYLRRFNVVVTVQDSADIPLVRSTVGDLCEFLSQLKNLDRLFVELRVGDCLGLNDDEATLGQVLERFSQLRPRTVTIEGAAPWFADYLTSCMTGSLLSELEKKYHAVCDCANVINNFPTIEGAYAAFKAENAKDLDILMEGISSLALARHTKAFEPFELCPARGLEEDAKWDATVRKMLDKYDQAMYGIVVGNKDGDGDGGDNEEDEGQ
jgi:hypothetical protein